MVILVEHKLLKELAVHLVYELVRLSKQELEDLLNVPKDELDENHAVLDLWPFVG